MGWGWLGIGKCPVELAPRPLATGAILVLRTGSGKKTSQAASCIAAQTPVLDLMVLCMYPTLVCDVCKASTPIVSSYAGEIHRHAVNLRSSLAKVAIGESHSSFETFCYLRRGGGRERDTIFVKKKNVSYIYIILYLHACFS